MTPRNAASVLPEPVGALISVCLREPIASQALSWTLVGPGKAPRNQPATAGWNCSGSMSVGLPYGLCFCPVSRRFAWEVAAATQHYLPNTTAFDVIAQRTVDLVPIDRF